MSRAGCDAQPARISHYCCQAARASIHNHNDDNNDAIFFFFITEVISAGAPLLGGVFFSEHGFDQRDSSVKNSQGG